MVVRKNNSVFAGWAYLQRDCHFFPELIQVIALTSMYFIIQNEYVQQRIRTAGRTLLQKRLRFYSRDIDSYGEA